MEELTIEMIDKMLSGSYTEEGIKKWWNRPRHLLNNDTPLVAWGMGRQQEVYNLILSMENGCS